MTISLFSKLIEIFLVVIFPKILFSLPTFTGMFIIRSPIFSESLVAFSFILLILCIVCLIFSSNIFLFDLFAIIANPFGIR